MILKRDVEVEGVKPQIYYAIGIVEAFYRSQGLRCIVTSLVDGKHSEGSLHYKGLAVDIRTNNIPNDLLLQLARQLHSALKPKGFDIVLEKTHLHIEWDEKNQKEWLSRSD